MGSDIQKGTTYAQGGVGGAGTVNADNLNAHVDEARIKATFVSSKTLRDPATLSDSIVVEAGGVLYRETFQQIIDLISDTLKVPVGTILDFAGASAPGGWLLCYGQTLLRDSYAELFDAIGTAYGSTDSTNFKLPDLRGRVAAGKDNMGGTSASRITSVYAGFDGTTLGAAGGDQRLHAHSHEYNNAYAAGGGLGGATPTFGIIGGVNTGTTGEGSSQNVQPTVIVNKIIRYQ